MARCRICDDGCGFSAGLGVRTVKEVVALVTPQRTRDG